MHGWREYSICSLGVVLGWLAGVGSVLAEVAPRSERVEAAQDEVAWQDGWLALFDRATPFGWRGCNPSDVVEGALQLTAGSLVRTSAQFSGGEVRLVYELSADGQAELLLLASPQARRGGEDHVAVPLEPGQQSLGLTVSVLAADASGPSGWRNRIVAGVGSDDEEVIIDGAGPNRGYLGFRVRAGQLRVTRVDLRPAMEVADRPQRLELGQGWDTSGAGAAEVTWQDGTLGLRGGPGYLATSDRYADFVLSVEARTAAGTNSGIFFRCIPGENLNGYESQIHNGYLAGDRGQPEDCGTGGIFRRVNARRVVADNDEWFRKVLIVSGGQISVWVNGYQVTDWSDQRAVNPNPRRGRRLEAGTIQLQAHDPGTQVDFRQFQIQELPPRAK